MSTSHKSSDEPQVPPKSSTVILLPLLDTTWRMFVPSIGFTSLGVWLDSKFHTAPWLMLAGVVAGLTVAALAVRMQLKKIE